MVGSVGPAGRADVSGHSGPWLVPSASLAGTAILSRLPAAIGRFVRSRLLDLLALLIDVAGAGGGRMDMNTSTPITAKPMAIHTPATRGA